MEQTPAKRQKAGPGDNKTAGAAATSALKPPISAAKARTPAQAAASSHKPQPAPSPSLRGRPVQQLLRQYYSRIFPHQQFSQWLAYGNDSRHPQADQGFFQRREICFTLDGDIFVRYQSFKNGDELRTALLRRVPAKIDIGPIYNVDPQRRNAYAGTFHPEQRELVFDIDLTDYDDVRSCGSGGHICNSCWPFMAVAVQVLDAALREDFGFQHVLWVFSGRRGVHAWVCDARARALTDEQRGSIAAYLSVFKGVEGGRVKLGLSGHPCMDRAYASCYRAFKEEVLSSQGLLEKEASWRKILGFLPDETLRAELHASWAARRQAGTPEVNVLRWQQLEHEVAKVVNARSTDKALKYALVRSVREIVFAHTYPRLDVEVSKKRNHLLKAPFCVHPKTGKVCVPFTASAASEFDPEAVPSVGQLLEELPAASSSASPAAGKPEWSSTSLAGCVATFCREFLEPLLAQNRAIMTEKARAAALKPTLTW